MKEQLCLDKIEEHRPDLSFHMKETKIERQKMCENNF